MLLFGNSFNVLQIDLNDGSNWKKVDENGNTVETDSLRPTALCVREEARLLVVSSLLFITAKQCSVTLKTTI